MPCVTCYIMASRKLRLTDQTQLHMVQQAGYRYQMQKATLSFTLHVHIAKDTDLVSKQLTSRIY